MYADISTGVRSVFSHIQHNVRVEVCCHLHRVASHLGKSITSTEAVRELVVDL